MRLYELFESPFTPPGISYVVNDPQDAPKPGQNMDPNTSGAILNTNANNQSYGASFSGESPANIAITANSAVNQTAITAAKQQLTKGAPINLQVGPAKQPNAMTVTNVSHNDAINKGETITIGDKQHPERPEQTYPADYLANIIANRGKQ